MFKKRFKKYMISYYFNDNAVKEGFGSITINTGLDFFKSENYNAIMDLIKQHTNFDQVVILNIIKLKN